MKRFPVALLVCAGAATVLACSDRSPTTPTPSFNINDPPPTARAVTVMTQNMYVGANVDLVIGALMTPDQSDDIPALLFAIETVQQTDFPARAAAIADEIVRARPHAVGLQEVSQIDIDLTPMGVPAVLNQDFLAIVQGALAQRGLNYQVAAMSNNIDVNLAGGLVRLRDHDVLLVDADRVHVDAASGQTFAVNLGQVAPGVTLTRGWVWARVTIAGRQYTFASAHPEANLAGAPVTLLEQIRAAQVGEIVTTLGAAERVIVMGDLNDFPDSPMYEVLAGSGFGDTWATLHPGSTERGYTCCHADDLSDAVARFDQRIDYIWSRGFGANVNGSIDRFGDVPADRLPGPAHPIWPSDHAGLVAALK